MTNAFIYIFPWGACDSSTEPVEKKLNEVPGGRVEEVCCRGAWQSSTDTVPSSLERRKHVSLGFRMCQHTATVFLSAMTRDRYSSHLLSRVYPRVTTSITAQEMFKCLVFYVSEVSWWFLLPTLISLHVMWPRPTSYAHSSVEQQLTDVYCTNIYRLIRYWSELSEWQVCSDGN